MSIKFKKGDRVVYLPTIKGDRVVHGTIEKNHGTTVSVLIDSEYRLEVDHGLRMYGVSALIHEEDFTCDQL